MTDERLRLKWNDFENLVQASFAELRTDTDFTDVTLACEDQSIKAHKVVLSACSPFFKKLLKSHPHPQPLICMRGIKSGDLNAIVDFIYFGEASVFQEGLESFLAVAEELQLKGFDGSSKENLPVYPKESFTQDDEKRAALNGNRLMSKIKHEGTAMRIQPKLQTAMINANTMAIIESLIEKRADGYSCTNCVYTSKHPGHMREHVEKHIKGLEYPCNSCNKVLRSSSYFREHTRKYCSHIAGK